MILGLVFMFIFAMLLIASWFLFEDYKVLNERFAHRKNKRYWFMPRQKRRK